MTISTSASAKRRITRVLALQPRMTVASFDEGVMATNDPAIVGAMNNLIRVWAWNNSLVPFDFYERMSVRKIARQPLIFATVDVERCDRQKEPLEAPLPPGSRIDQQPWPTEDLFKLMPLAAGSFPDAPVIERTPLPGREEASACSRCSGAGAIPCTNCVAGRAPCLTCRGALRVTCSQCNGSGAHMGISGRMIQCRKCNMQGTSPCDHCGGTGTTSCKVCGARGQVDCSVCNTYGNIRRSWQLLDARRTDRARKLLMTEAWPGDWESAFADSDLIAERVYAIEGEQPIITLDRLASAASQKTLATLLRETLGTHAAAKRSGEIVDRIIAVRVRFRCLYGYDVTLDYNGDPCEIMVAGGGEMIIARKIPSARRDPFSFGLRCLKRFLHALRTDEIIGPAKEFVRAVNEGRVHISDDLCLVPEATNQLRAQHRVTEAGYRCIIAAHAHESGMANIILDVTFALDEGDRQMLCIDIDLGVAHRDRFAALLEASHELPIGRLAVLTDANGTERVKLVDRRPYLTCNSEQYAGTLQAIATAARHLRESSQLA